VVVTFDDGYADNLHNAKPLLEKYDVPATVFVASGYVGSQTGFWKDILSMILLQPTELPPILEIRLNGSGYHWELGEVARYSQERFERHRLWTILSGRDPTMRQSLYRTLCALMVRSTKWERERVLDELVSWSGLDLTVRPSWHRTLMSQEVVQLEEGGLIEVGSHTESHPILSSRTLAEQRFEIVTGKECLEELLGREVENFAYPYGGRSHYTDETVGLVREAGFKKACSNFEGVVRRRADMWQLPRFLVRNWTGEEFHERLQYWLSN
jgi:peptidoglycan/xylan/chitin deacetylase (PgdA/CDA1 family)